jgi:hypothetical protein
LCGNGGSAGAQEEKAGKVADHRET